MTTKESLEKFIKLYPSLEKASRVTVAFSGGADSLALLYTLHYAFPSLEIIPVYVNHGLRPDEELEAEIEQNRKNCASIGLELVVETIEKGKIESFGRDNGITLEAAARIFRYERLERIPSDYLLTAHTKSDHIELIVMRMLTGSSLKALIGIRPRRGRILRPLIYSTRSDTIAFCNENKLEYVNDSSNDTDFCFRNRVRHNLSSLFDEETISSLLRISENLRLSEERDSVVKIEKGKLSLSLDRSEYLKAGPFGRNNALEEIYSYFEDDRMSESKKRLLEDVILNGGKANFKHFICISRRERVCFYRRIANFSCHLDEKLPYGLKFEKCNDKKALSFDINEDMFLRLSEEGDTIKLVEGEKKVASLLSEYKLPYAVVVDSKDGIVALFSSFLGGRDRLRASYVGLDGGNRPFWRII